MEGISRRSMALGGDQRNVEIVPIIPGGNVVFLRGNATRAEAPDLNSIGSASDNVAPFGMTSDDVN